METAVEIILGFGRRNYRRGQFSLLLLQYQKGDLISAQHSRVKAQLEYGVFS